MTIMINGYEVEIKAKYTNFGAHHNERFNKHDTMAVLNQISIWAHEASERYTSIGCNALSKTAKNASNDMYEVLESKSYFKAFE